MGRIVGGKGPIPGREGGGRGGGCTHGGEAMGERGGFLV